MAGGPGFEPRLTGSEPVVLPLNYPPRTLRTSLAHDLAMTEPIGKRGLAVDSFLGYDLPKEEL